jgi:phospholipid/cholesterol/gamma-HCH transport system substrate-binding protein
MRVMRFSKPTLVKVLAFLALSAVLTVVLAWRIGNLKSFSIGPLHFGANQYTLSAQFTDASGVFPGDAVKLAGVDVGRVTGTRIDHGVGVVEFALEDDVKLPRDTVVAVRWRNILGQRFIYLYPGNDAGRVWQDGQTIPVDQTENAGDLGQFLNELGPILKAIDPEKANAFLDAMNTALAGQEVSVRQLLDDGATLAGRLGSMDGQIKTLIGTSDTVMSTYAKQDRQIAQILDHLDSVGAQLHSMTGDIDHVVVNFADVQEQLDQLLKKNRGNIDASLSELDQVLQTLANNRAGLETTLCTLPAGLAGYFQTTSWGEWFNVRVVQILIRDRNGKTIFSQGETPQEHPKTTTPAYTGCQQSAVYRGPGAPGNTGGPIGPIPTPSLPIPTPTISLPIPTPTVSLPIPTPTVSLPPAEQRAAGFGDVGDLVDSALAGSGDGDGSGSASNGEGHA